MEWFGRVWEGLGGVGEGGEGWGGVGRARVTGGGYFLYIFSGFAIDRSKKYMKTIKIDRKIDAVDSQAAADNPPPPPGHNGYVYGTLQPPKPRQIVRCLGMLTHARSYLNPSTPLPPPPLGITIRHTHRGRS